MVDVIDCGAMRLAERAAPSRAHTTAFDPQRQRPYVLDPEAAGPRCTCWPGDPRMTARRTVLFVCLHGMGMSRLAAACFNRVAPPGWQAVSAGLEPGETLSPTAARLLAGTPAGPYLDRAVPRSMESVGTVQRLVALRKPSIRFELPGAEARDLAHAEFAEPLRDEIRARAERPTGAL